MFRVVLFLSAAFVAINSAHLLPSENYVKKNTPENIKRLKNLGPDDLAYVYSGQFEGDMVMAPERIDELRSGRTGRTGLVNTRYRWTDNIIPYKLKDEVFTLAQKNYIALGLQKIMDSTCVKFVPYDETVHKNYIFVTGDEEGCYSHVGMIGGAQQLNLELYDVEKGCFHLYTIVHEFMHALGFFHMQSATERDEYVKIAWENIEEGMENNFEKYGADHINQFGYGYDYGSVMHYPPNAFSKNGEDTIVALKDLNGETLGQQYKISDKDIGRINAMYCTKKDKENINFKDRFALFNQKINKLLETIFTRMQ